MEADMHPEGMKPFVDSLRNPWNVVMALLAVVVAVDMMSGLRLVHVLVAMQLKLMGHDPSQQTMRLVTLFGTFTRVDDWTRFLGWALLVFLGGIPLVSVLLGLKVSLSGK
jgi:hypothetical protein